MHMMNWSGVESIIVSDVGTKCRVPLQAKCGRRRRGRFSKNYTPNITLNHCFNEAEVGGK